MDVSESTTDSKIKKIMAKSITGSGFEKNPQNINRKGRPRKLVGYVNGQLSKEGYQPVSPADIREAYLQILNLPLKKVQEMTSEEGNFPILYRLVAQELLSKRGAEMLSTMLDRAIGKPIQAIASQSDINITISKEDGEL